MSVRLPETVGDGVEQFERYRAISSSAVVAFIMGLISLVALLFPALLVIPLVGVLLGILAVRKIRSRTNELTGTSLAVVGIVVSAVFLVGGATLHAVVHITEVPEGYQRISFWDLQPDADHPELPVSLLARQLDGQRIFIKGYVHPGVSGMGKVKRFVLVPDMKACCFGGQPKLTDMIEVTMVNDQRVQYFPRIRRLGGRFSVSDERFIPTSGIEGGYYRLEADYLK